MTVEASRAVRCGECGAYFELSPRNVRAARQRGETPRCRECRRAARDLSEAERERLRRWWLDRYSLDELLELGRGLG